MHTPGPWTIINCKNGRLISPEANGARGNIAHVYAKGEHNYQNNSYSSPEEMDANARLIAAAPDMLAALDLLLTDMDSILGGNAYGMPFDDERHPLHRSVMESRAAITKATEGSER